MSAPQTTREGENFADRTQRETTERVGVRLVRRSRASNFKWSTWKSRSGIGGQPAQKV